MTLRSIPPANRQSIRLSSMRAATRSGLVKIGAHLGSSDVNLHVENPFQPKSIRPNPKYQEQKADRYTALRVLANDLEELIATAVNSKEAEFWKGQLSRLKGFG